MLQSEQIPDPIQTSRQEFPLYFSSDPLIRVLLHKDELCPEGTSAHAGLPGGPEKGVPLNVRKREKFLSGFLTEKENGRLRTTYGFRGMEAGWKVLETAWELFDAVMKEVWEGLNYPFRSDKEMIRGYVETLKNLQGPAAGMRRKVL